MQKIKLFLFPTLLLIAGVAKAEFITDKVVINVYDNQKLYPGGDYIYISVAIESIATTVKYTAYQMSFELPDGLEVCKTDDFYDVFMFGPGGFYPRTGSDRTGWTYFHTLGAEVVEGNVLNVTCYSSTNALFKDTNGDLFDINVKASPYLKPGPIEIKVRGIVFGTPDEIKDEASDLVSTAVQAESTSTLTLKVSAENQYSTCILPFDYELPADGSLVAYTCNSHTDDVLLLTKVDKILAYTPYILYSEAGFSATITGTVDPTKYPEGGIVKSGHLVGTVVKQELTDGYVMQNKRLGAGTKFYRIDPGTPFAIPAGKCYVELPLGTNVSSFRFAETTSIDNSEFTLQSSEFYNVLGQRVSRMISGQIYIIDGRKVIAE